jgi:hypothetical protein
VIGPKTEHRYHPESKKEINAFADAVIARGGRNPLPDTVRFVTYTLRYPSLFWVRVEGLQKHWIRARVEATIVGDVVTATTENVSHLTLTHPKAKRVVLDGQTLVGTRFVRERSGKWHLVTKPDTALRKRPGLQGPIDDAWYDRFVFVTPTGKPLTEELGAWAGAEQARATEEWRRFFRGEAITVKDTEVTEALMREAHVVLWGDRQSNALWRKVAGKLPIRWGKDSVRVGRQVFAGATHAPAFIYPNPLAPTRYVLANSGLTFRDYLGASNSQHAPKLPDWTIRTLAGAVVAAGFFDERWQVSGENVLH